jgi:hypothetical protein
MTERICHHLEAIPLTTGSTPERKRGFSQSAVERAVKGVKATGAEIGKVEITNDKITVEIGGKADDDGARDASLVAMDRIAALRRVK